MDNNYTPPQSIVSDILAIKAEGFRNPLRFSWGFWHVWLYSIANSFSSIVNQVLYCGLALWITYSGISSSKCSSWSSFVCVSTGVVVAILMYSLMMLAMAVLTAIMLIARKPKQFKLETSIEVGPNGLLFQTPMVRAEILWAGIAKVSTRFGMVAIHTGPRSAILIPNKYFQSADERRALCFAVTSKLGKSPPS